MNAEKEAIEDEKCNFREILQKWKAFNHEPTGFNNSRDPRRCVSAGQPSNVPTGQSVPFSKKAAMYRRGQMPNPAFKQKKWPKLVTNAKVSDQPREFVGRAILRSEYGESKMAETYYTVKQHPRSLKIKFAKERFSPYARFYRDPKGDTFNFDALIYDLARVHTQSKVFGDKSGVEKLRVRTKYYENNADKNLRPSTHNTIWIPEIHQSTHFPYAFEPENNHNVLSLLEQQGANVVISNRVRFTPSAAKTRPKPSEPASIENGRYLKRLAAIYAAAGAYPEFCFAYLAGIFAVIDIGKPTPESSFFADALRNVSFPQPVGNLERMLNGNTHSLYSSSQFAFDPLDDALRAAAFASVSDPGSPYTREWQPVISCAKTPKQHIVNIMENAKDFFTCWLENCFISLLPTQYSKFASVRIETALVSNFMNALRLIDEPYLEQSTIAPWFAIEPTHILHPHEFKCTYGGCSPLGPADLSVVKVPYFENLCKVKRFDGVFELSLSWHSLRKNPFVWLLSESVSVNCEEMIDIRDDNWEQSLPSPLRIFNTTPQEPGVIGIQNDRAGGALDKLSTMMPPIYEKLDWTIWPLEVCEGDRPKLPKDSPMPDRVSESAKLISNREPPNCSEPSLIHYNVQGVPLLRTSSESGSTRESNRVKPPHETEPPKSQEKPQEKPKEPKEAPELKETHSQRSDSPVEVRSDLESGSEVEPWTESASTGTAESN